MSLIVFWMVAATGTFAANSISGRWEFVHISGDTTQQYNPNANPVTGFPGAFSTYLTATGSGLINYTSDSLGCDLSSNGNISTTWSLLSNGQFQVTFTVTGNSVGTFAFIYTGTYTTQYKQIAKDGSSVHMTAPYGNYTTSGNVSACNFGSGQFVATHFADMPSLTFSGTLDGADTPPSADKSSITANLNFASAPLGSLGGTIDVGTMTYKGKACFVPVSSSHAMSILSSQSFQSGMYIFIYATDKNGTEMLLSGYSANITTDMTDPNGDPVVAGNAVGAAFGEDDPNGGNSGITNDGTNNSFVVFYGITGGPCDGVGGGDSPFHPKLKPRIVPPHLPKFPNPGQPHQGHVPYAAVDSARW